MRPPHRAGREGLPRRGPAVYSKCIPERPLCGLEVSQTTTKSLQIVPHSVLSTQHSLDGRGSSAHGGRTDDYTDGDTLSSRHRRRATEAVVYHPLPRRYGGPRRAELYQELRRRLALLPLVLSYGHLWELRHDRQWHARAHLRGLP